MHQLGTEEKAALLLQAADDDETDVSQSVSKNHHDNFPVVAKRPKTYQRRRTAGSHPVLLFILILGVFVLGCVCGITIILYRASQDVEQSKAQHGLGTTTKVDLTVQKQLSESISAANFVNLNRSIESNDMNTADVLLRQWQSFSSALTRVNKLSYDVTLATYAPASQWNGVDLLDSSTKKTLTKFTGLTTQTDPISFSSLVKSGTIDANNVYYVNYGRKEDFAHLTVKNKIQLATNSKSIVFMRRGKSIISMTEQIRQAIRHRMNGVVLFDDDDQQTATTDVRESFYQEWLRQGTAPERQQFLDGVVLEADRSILLVILSLADVQAIFGSLEPDSHQWIACPSEWHSMTMTTPLKLGGTLQKTILRLTTNVQDTPVRLPIVVGHIRGTTEADKFVLVAHRLGGSQQSAVVNEMLRAYDSRIKSGWHPRRSIVVCAWSGLSYDHHTVRRWLADNYRLVDRNLVAYIDLGNGVVGNSTLNLHGSPLLHQVVHHAADFVASPLAHNHTCHNRQPMTMMMPSEQTEHHHHDRRRRDGDHEHHMDMETSEETKCEPHKLLDEWLRASNNRIASGKNTSMVQMIDADSSAALFQLQHGIPSLLVEMTDEEALTRDPFLLRKTPLSARANIQPEVLVAYTRFVTELTRQLVDEPLIPFSLTDYADALDKQLIEFHLHHDTEYRHVSSHIGDPSEFTRTVTNLIRAIRQVQTRIDQTSKTDYVLLLSLNQQLIEFERLFIPNQTTAAAETYKHILVGPATGLTNTVVPFPSLSNILFNNPGDPPTEFCDASKLAWSRLPQHIDLITHTLNGLDSLSS